MRFKYSELSKEKLAELEKKNIFVTREWLPDSNPEKDPPEWIEFGRPPMLNIPRWAAIRSDELSKEGKEMDEIYEILRKESQERNGPSPKVQPVVSGPNGETLDGPALTQEQQLWISYLQVIARMVGVNPQGMSPKELMDMAMAANVNIVPFEEYAARQYEFRKAAEEELKK